MKCSAKHRGGLRGGACDDPVQISASDVSSCVARGAGLMLGPELGRGEQGIAYSVRENSNQVIKVTELPSQQAAEAWSRESCYSKDLGQLGVAPQIYNYYICNGTGFIVMERLVTIGAAYPDVREKLKIYDEDGSLIVDDRGKPEYEVVDHVSLLPLEVQRGFVTACATMINYGYIHMDNHLDNVGFLMNAKPILFDFGFTQKRDFSGPNDYEWALAFSIFQFLEHAPLDEIEETIFFQIINSIFNDALEGPAAVASFTSQDILMPLKKGEYAKRLATFKKIACRASNKPENADIALGALCYAMLVQLNRDDRYESPFYAIIYEVRTGKSPKIVCGEDDYDMYY